jgi:hypothetical protein
MQLISTISKMVQTAPAVELGVALHPEDLAPDLAVPRVWEMPPTLHRLSYGLGAGEEAELVVSYDLFKERMQVRAHGNGYWHHAPLRCSGDLRCVYDELVEGSGDAVLPIAHRFVAHARARQIEIPTLARLIVTYVQSIEYRLVKDDPYGLVPPALVVNSTGDCDSKALLAVMLLRMVRIEAVIIESQAARHAMVGIGLPLGRDRIRHRGRSYAVVETTYRNWPIGRMPPKMASYRDWRVVPVRFSYNATD